ncbi:3-hydroxyacyl-CoA dehydrogenase [Klebsiella pneumoniae]|nr:3-hydroxyacyl-CoA dehydrogenase [Klebsiella pneumoniae]
MISAGCDPTSNYLKTSLQFFNINSTLRFIWYDQIILLDSGD